MHDDTEAPTLRVIVADDDLLLREGLASLLNRSGFDVIGQAGDAAQLLPQVRALARHPPARRHSRRRLIPHAVIDRPARSDSADAAEVRVAMRLAAT